MQIEAKPDQFVIALAGNPNVGKSTIFNALTGLRQHTGNWPGKTVNNALGNFFYYNKKFLLVDLPGTYSILAHTVEEEIARDFLCFGRPDVAVIVLDATSLERNLNLALQIMEITSNIVVCVNLIDEAEKKNIAINLPLLEEQLGVPVVATAARKGIGLDNLRRRIFQVAIGERKTTPFKISYSEEVEYAIKQLLPQVEHLGIGEFFDPRWVSLRLLDSDENFIKNITSYSFLHHKERVYREVELA